MALPTETGVLYTVGGVGAIALIVKLWKFAMQTMRVDKLESTAMMSDLTSYKRLQEEITRLELVIKTQQDRLEFMEKQFDKLREMQLDDVADVATLATLVELFPCHQCQSQGVTFVQTRNTILNMHRRRRRRTDAGTNQGRRKDDEKEEVKTDA
jgi:hypothetical protein